MGLDMYLRRVKSKEVAYWRKANAIHKWFVDNCAGGEFENCGDCYVSKDDLIKLKEICEKIMKECPLVDGEVQNGSRLINGKWEPIYEHGKVMTHPEIAQELLPCRDGFFFGSLSYDQWYYEDLESTVEQINDILETVDFKEEYIIYTADW